MDSMRIFQFAAIWNPTSEQAKEGKKAKIVLEPTTILAKDAAQANMLAARALPEDMMDELDQIDIAVRAF